MMDDSDGALFNRVPAAIKDKNYNPGLDALRFYTDFSNPAKEVYAWNKSLANSLEMFTRGKLAMMFGYAYHLPVIKAQAPKLNFGVTKLPQIEGNPPVNFANYWLETVSGKSKRPNEAWNFIQFMTRADQVKSYLAKTQKPTALRSLINGQLEDQAIGVFVEQLLTAKSWYKGANAPAAEKIFAEMIDSAVLGQDRLENIINLAASRVQQTVK